MNRKELADTVAGKFALKPGQSRKIVDHVLAQLLEAGLSGDGFSSPIVRVVSTEVPAKEVDTPEGRKSLPPRRLMRLVQSKGYVREEDKQSAVQGFNSVRSLGPSLNCLFLFILPATMLKGDLVF